LFYLVLTLGLGNWGYFGGMSNQALKALPSAGEAESPAAPSSLFDEEDEKGGKGIKRAAAKRQARTLMVVLAVLAAVVLAGVYFVKRGTKDYILSNYKEAAVTEGEWQNDIQLSASVELKDSRSVTAPEAGIMDTLLVEEGDWVKAGQVLMTLNPDDLADQLESALDSVAAKQRSIAKLQSDREYALKKAKLDADSLARSVSDLERQLSLKEKLRAQGSASDDEVASAREALTSARDKVAAAGLQAEKDAADYAYNMEEQAAALAKLENEAATLRERIASLAIKSPIEGKVLEVADAARERGASISAKTTLASVADTRKSVAKAKLPETNAAQVKPGMAVSIIGDSIRTTGKVERLGAIAKTDESTYGTYVDLYVVPDLSGGELLAGSSVSVGIDLGKRSGVLSLPRGAWYAGSSQDYVYLIEGGYATKTKVKFGSTSSTAVEVVSGLKAGDRVIVSDYRAFSAYDRVKLAD